MTNPSTQSESTRPAGPPPREDSGPPPDLVRRLERIEARAWIDFYRTASQAIRAEAGLSLHRVGAVVAAVASAYDALAFNRLIDLGGELDPASLDEVVSLYARLGVPRLFLPWPPPPPDAPTARELAERGFRLHNRWMKLCRGDSPAPRVDCAFTVERLGAADRRAFEEVMIACFDYPPPLGALFGATVGARGWHHFGMRREGRLIAAAGLRIDGETAWFGPAGTLPAHRGRGAQKALLARRIETARAAGCRVMSTETAEPAPDRPVPSFHNLRRMGFRLAYPRPNYVAELTGNYRCHDQR